jgi:hypothetical protein
MKVDIPDPPAIHVWGSHNLSQSELRLDPDSFALCGTILERLAYRSLAMELDSALTVEFSGQDRFNYNDAFVQNTSIVVRLIRNTVAHNLLDPVWKIDRKFQNRKLVIDGVLTFDTADLNGRRLQRLDFGGAIALFRLSERVIEYLRSRGG